MVLQANYFANDGAYGETYFPSTTSEWCRSSTRECPKRAAARRRAAVKMQWRCRLKCSHLSPTTDPTSDTTALRQLPLPSQAPKEADKSEQADKPASSNNNSSSTINHLLPKCSTMSKKPSNRPPKECRIRLVYRLHPASTLPTPLAKSDRATRPEVVFHH